MTILLKDLAERAKKGNWTITNEEAIDIWLIIPELLKRYGKLKEEFVDDNGYKMMSPMLNKKNYDEYLIIKGLGEFKIK